MDTLPAKPATVTGNGRSNVNVHETAAREAPNEAVRPKQSRQRKRPARPQTFQLGPLDPLLNDGQVPQDISGTIERSNAESRRYKPSKARGSGVISHLTDKGLGELRIGEVIGMPMSSSGRQGFDGQKAVASLSRNSEYLAGVHGATTDRRPHHLRSQNIRQADSNRPSRPPVYFGDAPAAPTSHHNTWRPPPSEDHGQSRIQQPRAQRPQPQQARTQQPRIQQPNPYRSHPYPSNIPRPGINVAHIVGTKFEQHSYNLRQVMAILERVPNPWPEGTQPFPSAYRYSLTHPDPRSNIPEEVLAIAQQSPLSLAILEFWKASEPSRENKETVVRIVNQVNAVLKDRYGKRWNFVVEPFGSVSWGGETGDTADVDLTLRDFDRPFGYTEDLWPKNGKRHPDLGGVYNVNALSRCLGDAGYMDLEPIRWANTPIVKFKDPTSGVLLDLNTNDLGGSANSMMILAYCRCAPFTLRPLIHIVKTWAKARNLNDPSGSNGAPTLSSYCWTLMCIAYLQVMGKVPNLQDETSVKHFGREKCVIWVSWGKPQGQAANIGFADYIPGDTVATAKPERLDDIVKGFFTFYYNMFRQDAGRSRESGVAPNGQTPDAHRHVISVWKGGLTNRSIPVDGSSSVDEMQQDATQEEAVQDMDGVIEDEGDLEAAPLARNATGVNDAPPGGSSNDQQRKGKEKRTRRFESAQELARGPAVDGFAQPESWRLRDLVVQDPFLHDKNCATALSPVNYRRITRELERAFDLFEQNAPLASLFEETDPLDVPLNRREKKKRSRKEQRSSRRKATAGTSSRIAAHEEAERKPESGDEQVDGLLPHAKLMN